MPDTLAALQQLAREHRRALGIPIPALTGSNGKTTTKELVHRVLSERFRTRAPRRATSTTTSACPSRCSP